MEPNLVCEFSKQVNEQTHRTCVTDKGDIQMDTSLCSYDNLAVDTRFQGLVASMDPKCPHLEFGQKRLQKVSKYDTTKSRSVDLSIGKKD